MTKEEAKEILTHNWTRVDNPNYSESELDEAFFMAIEALSEPKVIVGIDTPYGSDMGIATVFKDKDGKLFLEDVKEIMSVVRCKDCTHRPHLENENGSDYGFNVRGDEMCPCVNNDDGWYSWMPKDNFYCGFGERKGGDDK